MRESFLVLFYTVEMFGCALQFYYFMMCYCPSVIGEKSNEGPIIEYIRWFLMHITTQEHITNLIMYNLL